MQFDSLPGWFMPIDQAVFTFVLREQMANSPLGGLVDLGVFKGKSAVLMGTFLRDGEVFTACDLFEEIADHSAADKSEQDFFKTQSLSQAEFESNYLSFHKELPRVVRGPTGEICRHVAPASARFVHVDAGHTYDLVKEDIASTKTILREGGVVAISDFFQANTVGTAAAIWEEIWVGGLNPIAHTQFKLYATWGDPKPMQDAIRHAIRAENWIAEPKVNRIGESEVLFVTRRG